MEIPILTLNKKLTKVSFAEGNGRTNREFIRQLALKNGYVLNLKNTPPQEVLDASIKSVIDTTDLEKIIEEMLEKQ